MIIERKNLLLNALASYMRQTTVATKKATMQAFEENSDITDLFVLYFNEKFNPELKNRNLESIETKINELNIKNIALKTTFSILKAMLRTNFFQKDKDYIAFRFNSQEIQKLPKPKPIAEIFVTSKEVDAVYLSLGKIARGGIRWIEKKEGLRTEVLKYLRIQQAKSAVIVPEASKGGFFVKNMPETPSKEEQTSYALTAYGIMIKGLLDLMDNIVDGKNIAPENVVCYDEFDPYLVVHVDKSSSGFADLANKIAKDYNFWLGDTFASGGSDWFNRKSFGITAKGAWHSVKPLFKEANIDYENEPFSVTGVGSMAGSVFGNAMLVSKKIKLIAAFNSSFIFIDPNPDLETSYNERQRLFEKSAGWGEYNTSLISSGGGIFARNEKAITLSKQACEALGISKNILSPNELIKAILTAPVDVLFFGGIGTYVKGSNETNFEVHDSINDKNRINAFDIKAKIITEGANLALTSKARSQYALNGGFVNSDIIDNAASIECSDYEVNLKILFYPSLIENKITINQRNDILIQVKNEVEDLIISDIENQIKAIAYTLARGAKSLPTNKKLMLFLKKAEDLNPDLEALPSEEEMNLRFAENKGLTRPEIAILMAYTKRYIKNEILKTSLCDDTYLKEKALFSYFPVSLVKEFKTEILNHMLCKEIISMKLSNDLVNRLSINFIFRLLSSTKGKIFDIVKAYYIIEKAYKIDEIFDFIEQQNDISPLNNKMIKKRKLIAELEKKTAELVKKGLDNDCDIDTESEKLKNVPNDILNVNFFK